MRVWEKKREIIQRYNVTAGIYDMRYAEEQASKIEAALKNMKIAENGLSLDVGCGTGVLFGHIVDRAKLIIGLDISKKMLLVAKRRAKAFRNVCLVMADTDNMPLKTDVFSCVFAFTVIQNVPDPYASLKEIKRVAKQNAVFVVTGLKSIYSEEDFQRLLCNAGFLIVALRNEVNLKCYVAICTRIDHQDRAVPKLNYI